MEQAQQRSADEGSPFRVQQPGGRQIRLYDSAAALFNHQHAFGGGIE
jgi:hypothetical protein